MMESDKKRQNISAYHRTTLRTEISELLPLGILLDKDRESFRLLLGHWSTLAFPQNSLPVIPRAEKVRTNLQETQCSFNRLRITCRNPFKEILIVSTGNA